MTNLHESYVAELGFELATSESVVRPTTDCIAKKKPLSNYVVYGVVTMVNKKKKSTSFNPLCNTNCDSIMTDRKRQKRGLSKRSN